MGAVGGAKTDQGEEFHEGRDRPVLADEKNDRGGPPPLRAEGGGQDQGQGSQGETFPLLDWVDLWHQKLFSLDLAAAMINLCCAGGRPSAIRGAAAEDDGRRRGRRGGTDGRRRRKHGATDRNQGLVGLKPLTSALSSFLKTIKQSNSDVDFVAA